MQGMTGSIIKNEMNESVALQWKLGTSWHVLARLGTSWKQDREEDGQDGQDTLFFVDTGGVPCQDGSLWAVHRLCISLYIFV